MIILNHEGIFTFMDCPDRLPCFGGAWCGFGTDKGWVENNEGEIEKAFLHPCDWRHDCKQCPRGYAR